jgi:hypothetical protein
MTLRWIFRYGLRTAARQYACLSLTYVQSEQQNGAAIGAGQLFDFC